MRLYIVLAIVALLLFGCITQSAQLGCCLKKNATDDEKCALFNISSGKINNLYDKTNSCNVTDGYCNVTVGSTTKLVPVCTQDDPQECLAPDCVAMVCGDFKYSPRIAPGYSSEDDFEEGAPPPEDEGEVAGLYNAKCEFLPVDSSFGRIMKKTNGVINRFRFGAGGSFDEYDLYKNYFPMSDKFCTSLDFGQVDRYMNYIDSELDEYNPYVEITENCMNDSDILPPFTFNATPLIPLIPPVLPEKSSYKFAENFKFVRKAKGLHNIPGTKTLAEVYKKLDREWYRKTLASVYAMQFYDETAARAPFECDASTLDCMSGICDITYYSRGVSVVTDAQGNEQEVPTDCNSGIGPDGKIWTFCMPTESVTPGVNKGDPPKHTYAKVSVKPWMFTTRPTRFSAQHLQKTTFDGDFLHPFDEISFCSGSSTCPWFADDWQKIEGLPNSVQWTVESKDDCPEGVPYGDPFFGLVQCPPSLSGTGYPPAAQIAFFNRDDIMFEDAFGKKTQIIGYAVVDPNEFKDTLLAKNCGLYDPITLEFNYTGISEDELLSGENELDDCKNDCQDACGSGAGCTDYCNKKVNLNQEPPPLCNYTREIRPNPNFIEIELDPKDFNMSGGKGKSEPKHEQWELLAKAFKPIHEDRLKFLGTQGWNNGDNSDLLWSTTFWVPGYTAWAPVEEFWGNHQKPYFVSGAGSAYAMETNIYERNTPDAKVPTGTALVQGTQNHPKSRPMYYYYSLWPRHILLFKTHVGPGGKEMLGNCEVTNNGLEVKQYGWCEPCTLSTLAYQKVTTEAYPYLPDSEYSTETGKTIEDICVWDRSWAGGLGGHWEYTAKCDAPHISDIEDYNENEVTVTGSPRTEPEASLMKERLGIYLKSGIMPVLDISDPVNWDLTSPYATDFKRIIFGFIIEEEYRYSEYDFQRLLGNEGAIVVIADSTDNGMNITRFIQRTNLVKAYCPRCLVAIDIPAIDAEEFKSEITSVFANPLLKRNVDIITNHYATTKVSYEPGATDAENAQAVIDDMKEYGRASLRYEAPVLFVSFTVPDSSPWNKDNFETLMTRIVEKEEDLVKAGVIGFIYRDVRDPIVNANLADPTTGEKNQKFCGLEKATGLLGSTKDFATFTKGVVADSVNCTKCNSLEISIGLCDPTCDNGVECTVPAGGNPDQYKCPENTVIAPCTACSDIPGHIVCNITYTNGTKVPSPPYDTKYVTTESYADIIGGLKKPDKCCLEGVGGNYTFNKHVVSNAVTAALIYPRTGAENVDCGFGTNNLLEESGAFCGAQVPIKNYDIECSLIPSGETIPPVYRAVLPDNPLLPPSLPPLVPVEEAFPTVPIEEVTPAP